MDNLEYEEKDLSLREIRALIRQTNYDEALKLLTIYIDQNPENFDNAQRLVATIMDAKKRYAETLDNLIETIATDPDNSEKIYSIIRQLKKIERHPSDASLAYIDNIDRVVTFAHNQKESTRIINTSAQLVENKEFIQAVAVVQEGFVLCREEYEDRWGLDSDILKETDEIVTQLNQTIADWSFEEFNVEIDEIIEKFNKAVKEDDYPLALELFPQVEEILSRYCNYRQTMNQCGKDLIALNERLKEMSATVEGEEQTDEESERAFFDSTDASYLPFMAHFIFGDSKVAGSGLIPSVDSKYNYLLDLMNSGVYEQVSYNYNSYKDFFKNNIQAFESQSTNQSSQSIKKLEDYVSLEKKIIDLSDDIYLQDPDFDLSAFLNPLARFALLDDYIVNLVEQSERIYKVNSQINEIAANQNKTLDLITSAGDISRKSILVSQVLDSTAEIGNLVGVKSQQEIAAFEWSSAYIQAQEKEFEELDKLYSEYLNKIFEDSSKSLNQGWEKIVEYYKNSSETLVNGLSKNNDIISLYLNGFTERLTSQNHSLFLKQASSAFDFEISSEENPGGLLYKYPDIADLMSSYNMNLIDQAYVEIDSYENVIMENYDRHEQWHSDPGISSLISQAQEFFNQERNLLSQFYNKSEELKNASTVQIAASDILRSDAQTDFEDAEDSLNRENFENARNKLKASSEKYARAFEIQSDLDFSLECDEKIQELGLKITRLENEKVVRDVRELKTLAKNAYLDGDFDSAERYLTQAANRWSVTNSEADPEISNLQVFVNTAMNSKNGREILPSSPQYEEMTQLLTIAYQYYDEGLVKLKEGDKDASNLDFDNSESSLRQLQLVYPLHQEAALLNLRISKLRDPKKFEETFAQKIENARLMCKSNNSETKMEGYANLQDYYELDPNYKNLKNILYQAEFDVGIRQHVDNSNITKAKNLYREARNLFRSGKLEAANAKISQSLALNPDDTSAQTLSDNINIAIGGTKIPLSTQAQLLYSKSYDNFNQNNYEMAEYYINRIEKLDRRFMNDDDVKRLKEKIDALK
ncbi:MAG: hypothetical protein K5866_06820 [Treponema sp.]|nr:hypothetical protein [Treponema sp.]